MVWLPWWYISKCQIYLLRNQQKGRWAYQKKIILIDLFWVKNHIYIYICVCLCTYSWLIWFYSVKIQAKTINKKYQLNCIHDQYTLTNCMLSHLNKTLVFTFLFFKRKDKQEWICKNFVKSLIIEIIFSKYYVMVSE